MKYDFGSITVTAEIQDETDGKIENFSDVTAKYGDLGQKQKEHLYAVFLTNANEEIGDKLIGLGSSGSVSIDIQDVARTALLVNAGAVILVHNHPSGQAEATQQDIETTQEVKEALDTVGIQLLDHVIIARNNHYSMRGNADLSFDGGEA